MGRLSTHVLDTAAGRPAVGVKVVLARLDPDPAIIAEAFTDADGRLPAPLLAGESFAPGRYEMTFHVADYFRARGVMLPDPPYLDTVPVRFALYEDAHFHVPLLVSPYGYTTYRGS